jgi:hypothetical protein
MSAIMDVISHSDRPGYHSVAHADEVSRIVAVPAVEWCVFLERFSRRHRGWLGTVHGVEEDLPLTRMASERLESVSLERSGFDHLVRLTFANGISLCAPKARAVRVQRSVEGAEAALEVETAAGAFIRLAFRATALPDELDGVAPAELSTERRIAS